MRTTLDFLDAVKARHSIDSDYKLAQVMGVTRSCVSNYRNRKSSLDDDTALKVAELLDLSPGIVLSAVHAERAKSANEKAAWNSIFEKLGGLAASLFLLAILAPSPADASVSGLSQAPKSALYIMSNRKRPLSKVLNLPIRALFSLLRLFPAFR